MKQLVQSVKSGALRITDVPSPVISSTQVLVATSHSVLSAGTERAARQLATAGMLGKARARPDLVGQIVRKARTDGLLPTVAAVRTRLQADMPLGYSAAGTVVSVGEAVSNVRPGQRVATAGAGHAELQVVQGLLAVPIPDGVDFDQAAFATIGAIATHGLRLAEVGPGSKICVIGLGLLGQLAVRLAIASGCDVVGVDVREWAVDRARDSGALALIESGEATTEAILSWTRGRGADAVLLTAATPSSDPMRRAPHIARDRANLVVIGDVGLDLQRTPLYEKELTVRFARSYGPGRYDATYEQLGVDYPIGQVRWTEGRNLESFLDLLASGRIAVRDLVTHSFPFDRAGEAYAIIAKGSENFLGVELTYGQSSTPTTPPAPRPRAHTSDGVGLIGAGSFAKATLIPALRHVGFAQLVAVASASGLGAARMVEDGGFQRALSEASDVIADPDVHVVVIATRHDSHAEFASTALEAGKHVFCEKPLALNHEDLDRVAKAWRAGTGHLMVGFNRRYSPAVVATRDHFTRAGGGPLIITYRVNAGRLSPTHWYNDRRHGGRLLGEVCHFVDTCSYLAGSAVESVYCMGAGVGEALLEQDMMVTLRYADGSNATIAYASGGYPGTAKERIEVLGRGRSALIDDFRSTVLDERKVKVQPGDKGHRAELAALRRAINGEIPANELTLSAIESTSATLAAAESLLTGAGITPRTF